MRHAVWLTLLLALGCGRVDFEIMTHDQRQDRRTWTCPGDEFVYEMSGGSFHGSQYQTSLGCIGFARCPNLGEGELQPEDPRCRDPQVNVFVGTCVEAFIAGYDPSGTCTDDPNGGHQYANGARLVGSHENGAYYDSTGALILLVERANDVGVIDYRFARPK